VKGFVSFSSPSLSPFSFLGTTAALKDTLSKKENERRRWMGNRQRNRAKTFSLLLLKEKDTTVGEGAPIRKVETTEQKTLSLSHLMQMRRALTDEMHPD
jgi:hypothetical protein